MRRSVIFFAVAIMMASSTLSAFLPPPLPTTLPPASMKVYPWLPTSAESVSIRICDSVGPIGYNPPPAVADPIVVTTSGSTIRINAQLHTAGTADGLCPIHVLVGPLPPGRYTIEYDGTANEENPSVHRATIEFSVSNEGFATVVEFVNSVTGHYFMTANPAEIAKLDQGVIRGWTRTGDTFKALSPVTMPTGPGAYPVCRLYGLPEAGLDSHFFADNPSECAEVLRKWPTQWVLETANAFANVDVSFGPNSSRTQCGDLAQPLYRLYNNKPDANHRYTVSKVVRDAMVAQGWILEAPQYDFAGDRSAFAMCVLR